MPKLLQINVTVNWGSTGRIVEQIGILAQQAGFESYVAYGRYANPTKLETIKVGNCFSVYGHYLEYRLFDNDGLASRYATIQLIKKIEKLQPDIIHLHNIHDHWLNYQILFEYLNTLNIPVVWTQHDCWSFTGGCGYFSLNNCDKWQRGCNNCLLKQDLLPLKDQTKRHFEKKKRLFRGIKNLTLVPVSHWLETQIKRSFLNKKRIVPIYNGVDIRGFCPGESKVKAQYGVEGKVLLVGVAIVWSTRKGLSDFIKLAAMLPDNIVIMLVGVNDKQKRNFPNNIIGVDKTQKIEELVNIYRGADIVLNLSYEETFGLTTVEGLACGTPGVVYNATASPELITPETGIVVEPGDLDGVLNAVNIIMNNGKSTYSKACRERAVKFFNKEDRFADYISLYKDLIKEKYVSI